MSKIRTLAHFLDLFRKRFPNSSDALELRLLPDKRVVVKIVTLSSAGYLIIGLCRCSPASFRGIRCGIYKHQLDEAYPLPLTSYLKHCDQ